MPAPQCSTLAYYCMLLCDLCGVFTVRHVLDVSDAHWTEYHLKLDEPIFNVHVCADTFFGAYHCTILVMSQSNVLILYHYPHQIT